MGNRFCLAIWICFTQQIGAQDYFTGTWGPFNPAIPSPENFLGYPVGSHHTRHDRIVDYFEALDRLSPRAVLSQYGETYEHRPLIMLTVSMEENMNQLDSWRSKHLMNLETVSQPDLTVPVFVNLGYGVHGNEPSSAEAAMLIAYILVASEHPEIKRYRQKSIFFIDPVINPDGRDRHSAWANTYKGMTLSSDPADVEHNEAWPRGRTNHYWFDLNRDWWLAVHPESRSKLRWYHEWYPNVVTDFHEMGTGSTHFFEPMKTNASKDPIMPKENYTDLNDSFALHLTEAMHTIGSLYFTREVFDGTYPGYGSSYPDLQGGLGILFEQASSRGHIQKSPMGDLTFAFTIRNQLVSSLATIKASVTHSGLLRRYQQRFFKTAIEEASASKIKGYVFGDPYDQGSTRNFLETLLLHKIKVYALESDFQGQGQVFRAGVSYFVPTAQPQYRMIRNAFESYDEYVDSVFYDASAWSLVNFYNQPYVAATNNVKPGREISSAEMLLLQLRVDKSNYAYLVPWEDYQSPALLHHLQKNGIRVMAAFKPFTTTVSGKLMDFSFGTLVIPISKQDISSDSLHKLLMTGSKEFSVPVYPTNTGYHLKGVDLGSPFMRPLEIPKPVILIDGSVSSYEAGEVWHALDTRIQMPLTKVSVFQFGRLNLEQYNTLILVSGNYPELDSNAITKIKDWVSKGNTLILSRLACAWAVRKKLIEEKLIEPAKESNVDSSVLRLSYVNASEEIGKESVGGAIFEVDLDITHPIGFGYRRSKLPVYRNSNVWISPSKNAYSTVAKYSKDPHIDGFITSKNLEKYLKPSASVVVSGVGQGRVILFADNPLFRGSFNGTNKLFFNALFFGKEIRVPE